MKTLFIFSIILSFISFANASENTSNQIDFNEVEACIYDDDESKYMYPEVELPGNLLQKKTGEYDLTALIEAMHSSQANVKWLAYLPYDFSKDEMPTLIIYYHWYSKSVDNYKSISNLKTWAKENRFILLSVQNMWPLGIGAINNDVTNLEATSIASKLFVEALIKNKIIDKDMIFTTWFSAWGLVALAIWAERPDIYRGVGDIKGNYYADMVPYLMINRQDMKLYALEKCGLNLDSNIRKLEDLKIYYSLWWVNEAERIKTQIPEAVEYFKNLVKDYTFKEYPNESHEFSKINFQDFWSSVVLTSKKVSSKEDNKYIFSDISSESLEWNSAIYLHNKWVINGYPDWEFKGDRFVNRAEAAKFLLLSKGISEDEIKNEIKNSNFPDVVNSEWYAPFVSKSSELGIINGYPDWYFRPSNNVNAAEFLIMISKTFDLKPEDDKEIWYEKYKWVIDYYDLFPNQDFIPEKQLTRNEVSVGIYQFLSY